MEPLKKVQVEGYVMFAEPEVLFGNLDELCCVIMRHFFSSTTTLNVKVAVVVGDL